nr:YciI family protein [Hamadaea sp.]
MWASESPVFDERYDAWQRELADRGAFLFGNALGGPETATTLRIRAGALELADGPFLVLDDFVAGLDVIACPDRDQAIAWAVSHPLAQQYAVEVRPFHPDGPA